MENDIAMQADKASTKCIKLCLNRSVSSNHQWMTLTAKQKRESNMEQLEKCRIKYQELTKNKLTKP